MPANFLCVMLSRNRDFQPFWVGVLGCKMVPLKALLHRRSTVYRKVKSRSWYLLRTLFTGGSKVHYRNLAIKGGGNLAKTSFLYWFTKSLGVYVGEWDSSSQGRGFEPHIQQNISAWQRVALARWSPRSLPHLQFYDSIVRRLWSLKLEQMKLKSCKRGGKGRKCFKTGIQGPLELVPVALLVGRLSQNLWQDRANLF